MEPTMHCPDCGCEALADQRYCRACGLNLERFAQLLAEVRLEMEDENAALTRRRLRQLEKAGKTVGLIVGSVIWIYFTFIGVLLISSGAIGQGALFFLLGVGSIAALLIGTYCTPLREKVSTQRHPQAVLAAAETIDEIPHQKMSVTERTTSRLEEKIKPGRWDE
jgi:hypothetical protein